MLRALCVPAVAEWLREGAALAGRATRELTLTGCGRRAYILLNSYRQYYDLLLLDTAIICNKILCILHSLRRSKVILDKFL